MSTDQTTFKNDNINVTLIRKPGCIIHLEVFANPEAVKAAYQKALKIVAKEVLIPGFRKGKAPEAMIQKNFTQAIDREWRDVLLNTSFEEAVKLTTIYPFSKNSVSSASVKSISQDSGATLLYQYEAIPQVPHVSPQDLSVPTVNRKPVTEKEIQESLDNLCLQQGEWNDIVDRPAQEGDFVDVDIEAVESGRQICKNTRFKLSSENMGEWMRHLLIGMKPGDAKEGMSEQDHKEESCSECAQGDHDHSHHHHADFVPTLCRITLNAIKNAVPAALDDEFAKKYGATSAEDMKQKMEINLNKRADEEQQDEQRFLMEKALLSKYAFDVPGSLLKQQQKQDSSEHEGDRQDPIYTEQSLRLSFLLQRIAQDHKLSVTQDEVMKELMRQMWLQQMGENTVDMSVDPQQMQSELYMQIISKKALDFLINHTGSTEKT